MPLEIMYRTFYYEILGGCVKMSQAKINWRPPNDLAPVGVSLCDMCLLGIGSRRGPSQSLCRLEHAVCLLGLGIVWLHASHLKLDILYYFK
jgi:hypothetical protein